MAVCALDGDPYSGWLRELANGVVGRFCPANAESEQTCLYTV